MEEADGEVREEEHELPDDYNRMVPEVRGRKEEVLLFWKIVDSICGFPPKKTSVSLNNKKKITKLLSDDSEGKINENIYFNI